MYHLKIKLLLFIYILSNFGFSFYINKIKIIGNNQTKEKIILRELMHPFPSDLDTNILKNDRDRLYNLGLFSSVEVSNIDSVYIIGATSFTGV